MNGQEIVWQILKAFEDFQLFFLSISASTLCMRFYYPSVFSAM